MPSKKKAKGRTTTKPHISRTRACIIVDLPLDVLCNIFTVLGPEDLISLSRTCVAFRHALLHQQLSYVWKKCRQREGAPDCPENLSEHQWVVDLFSKTCMGCGKVSSGHEMDFHLRLRLCKPCQKSTLTRRCDIPGTPSAMWKYVPHTRYYWGESVRLTWYNPREVEIVRDHFVLLQANVDRSLEGAEKALEDYKTHRIELVKRIESAATLLYGWRHRRKLQRNKDREAGFAPRYDEIVQRFTQMGYKKEDVDLTPGLRMHKLVRQKQPLTDKAWKAIRYEFKSGVEFQHDERLEREEQAEYDSRIGILKTLYGRYMLSQVPASEWKYLPVLINIYSLAPIEALFESEPDVSVTEECVRPYMDQLTQLLDQAYEACQARLLNRFLKAKYPLYDGLETAERFQRIELASMPFRCGTCSRYIFGRDAIKTHSCTSRNQGLPRDPIWAIFPGEKLIANRAEFPHTFLFDAKVADIAQHVVSTAGCDPRTATLSEMDKADHRFRCLECVEAAEGTIREAFNWKAMINHAMSHEDVEGETYPGCDLVPEQHAVVVKRLEAIFAFIDTEEWTCTHCTEFMFGQKLAKRSDVVQHLADSHQVNDPRDTVDMIRIQALENIKGIKYDEALTGTYLASS